MPAIRERIWLLEIEALDASNVSTTLYFASGDYISGSAIYYDKRLKQPANYTVGAFGNPIIKGSNSGFGEITLVNTDGGLDYLADYAVDGRSLVLKLKDENAVITEIVNTTIQSVIYEDRLVTLRIKDFRENLSEPHLHSKFQGDNVLPAGLEGVSDLKDKPKPRVFGEVYNASPVQVNSAKLIYQVHDSSVNTSVAVQVNAVYDKGIELVLDQTFIDQAAFEAGTTVAGKYNRYLGYIKLGSSPAGEITIDASATIYKLGDVFQQVVEEVGFTANSTDIAAANLYDSVGFFVAATSTTAEILDALAVSYGGFWTVTSGNVIRLAQLAAPSASPTVVLQDYEITGIQRNATGAGSNNVPVYSVVLNYNKNWTIQNSPAFGVPEDRRNLIAKEYKTVAASNAGIKTRYLLSEEQTISTFLNDAAIAQSEATRLQTLLGVRRDAVKVDVRLAEDIPITALFSIGQSIKIISYKFGYSSGRNFIITGFTIDARLSRATLSLWG